MHANGTGCAQPQYHDTYVDGADQTLDSNGDWELRDIPPYNCLTQPRQVLQQQLVVLHQNLPIHNADADAEVVALLQSLRSAG